MIDLYEFPPTRSQRAKWVLEELALDYTSHIVDLSAGEQDGPEYRSLHPLGAVPAIKTEQYAIFESVAIVLQLIDEHPNSNLAPAVGTPARALYYQWCVFACAELDPAIMLVFDHAMRPNAPRDEKIANLGRSDFAIRGEVLSKELSQRDYILGDTFSAADILIGHSCFMATFTGLIGHFPVLEAYYQRLQQRPGYQRAYPNS